MDRFIRKTIIWFSIVPIFLLASRTSKATDRIRVFSARRMDDLQKISQDLHAKGVDQLLESMGYKRIYLFERHFGNTSGYDLRPLMKTFVIAISNEDIGNKDFSDVILFVLRNSK